LGQKTHFVFRLINPSSYFTIRIFNIKGRLVRNLTDEYDWDGRDNSGKFCEGGLYIFRLEVEGRHIHGTVVVMER